MSSTDRDLDQLREEQDEFLDKWRKKNEATDDLVREQMAKIGAAQLRLEERKKGKNKSAIAQLKD